MAKKKRSSKKKKQPYQGKVKAEGAKAKQAERLTMGNVLLRLSVFMLVAAGLFYLVLNFAVGGNALWKVFVLTALPFGNLMVRKQFFEAPGLFGLLKPTLSKLSLSLGAFVLANGLSYVLFRFLIQGRAADDMLARISSGILFVVSPVFAFALKLKVTSWASFSSLSGSLQSSLIIASVLYYYGCVAMVQLETGHDPAKQQPLHMLPV